MDKQYEWKEYYDAFPYFSEEGVRDGCHPRKFEHPTTHRAIVLVHGLTDSPYFMEKIAEFFYHNLGYNVYLPLLHCHGLKEPKNMAGVSLEEWKKNVSFSLDIAESKAKTLSVGGFSTGGTLSLYFAVEQERINGALYLFSSALDLAGGILGDLKELFLRTSLTGIVDYFDRNKPLIGENPFRYDRIDIDGAKELAKLLKETDQLLSDFSKETPFPKKVFAAHSESDTIASIGGIEQLLQICSPERYIFYRIPKKEQVLHASLVLKEPVYAASASNNDQYLEPANPVFNEMMETIRKL